MRTLNLAKVCIAANHLCVSLLGEHGREGFDPPKGEPNMCRGCSRVLIVSPPSATWWTVGLPIRYQIGARIGVALEAAKTRYEQRAAAGASKLDAYSHAERLALQSHPIWMRLKLCLPSLLSQSGFLCCAKR